MREFVNSKLLAVVMITGFLFSAGSSYLNQLVFADDPWSDIVARQQSSEQTAIEKYNTYYQFANMDASKTNWAGLNTTATDETSRGRDIADASTLSAQNAISAFDGIHSNPLANIASDYTGLTSTATDEQGRDRTAMINSATASSLVSANDVLSQLIKIQQNYNNFGQSIPTDETTTYDRQMMINQNEQTAVAQAAALVNSLARTDQVYVNLGSYSDTTSPYAFKAGSTTGEFNYGGRNLPPQEAYSLEKAVMIYNEIQHASLNSYTSNYNGLSSTPTNEQVHVDRNTAIAQAQTASLTNALNDYNSYYNGTGLK